MCITATRMHLLVARPQRMPTRSAMRTQQFCVIACHSQTATCWRAGAPEALLDKKPASEKANTKDHHSGISPVRFCGTITAVCGCPVYITPVLHNGNGTARVVLSATPPSSALSSLLGPRGGPSYRDCGRPNMHACAHPPLPHPTPAHRLSPTGSAGGSPMHTNGCCHDTAPMHFCPFSSCSQCHAATHMCIAAHHPAD